MANTKKVKLDTETTDPKIVNDEFIKEDSKDKVIDDLQKQMEEMRKLIISMQSSNVGSKHDQESNVETLYEIGTRFINGVTIFSPMRDVKVEMDFGKIYEIELHELNSILKNPQNREWLEKDILFFTDTSLYAKKKLNRQYHLDDKSLVDIIMNNETEDIKLLFNKMTDHMNYDPMIHCLFYRVAELVYDGKLNNMSYPTRQMIEKMFKFDLNNAEMLFSRFKEINR